MMNKITVILFTILTVSYSFVMAEEIMGMPGMYANPETVAAEIPKLQPQTEIKEENDPEETKLFLLKNVSLYDMEKLLYDKFKPREMIADKKKNGFLITTNKKNIEAIEKFLVDYDKVFNEAVTEEEANISNQKTKVFKIKNIEIEKARDHLQTHFRNISVSRDELRSIILVTGTQSTLNRVEEVIKAIDIAEMNIKTEHIPLYYRDAQLVATIIKNNFNSKVTEVDKDRNSVIISDTNEKVEKILNFLRKFDFKPPTILIEGTIIKIDQGKAKVFGAKYQHNYERQSKIPIDEKGENTVLNIAAGDVVPEFANIAYTFETGGGKTMSVSLGMLVSEGVAETLLKPHINFISGKKGSFEQNDITHREMKSTDGNVGYETKIGLNLLVGGYAVPYENKYKIILNELKLTNGESGESKDKELVFDAPQIVDDGQLIILGGAITRKESIDEVKMPFLGDIPILGELFKYKTKETNVSETLALLRLKVIDSDPLAYAYKASQFEELKKLEPIEFGGETNDSISEHPLKTAEWSSKIIYNGGGGYFEKIYGKYSAEIQEKGNELFKKKIRSRLNLVFNWSDRNLIKKMIENDHGIKNEILAIADTLKVTPYELLIMARHKGAFDDELYLFYLERMRKEGIENFRNAGGGEK